MDRIGKFLPAIILVLTAFLVFPPALRADQDVVLVLDNSGSMKQNDPNFLTHQAVTEFIHRLSEDTHVAIVIFGQKVHLAVPLTPVTDGSRPTILASLDQVNFRGLFTDSPAAIERAIYELNTAGRPGAQKRIIFMTDGIVDTGDRVRDVEKSRWLREDLAVEAAESGIRIYGVAFTDQADFHLIQRLARNTNGEYFRAFKPEDLPRVFTRITSTFTVQPTPAPVVRETIAPPPVAPEPVPPPPLQEVTEEFVPATPGPVSPEPAAAESPEPVSDYQPLDLDLPEEPAELAATLDTTTETTEQPPAAEPSPTPEPSPAEVSPVTDATETPETPPAAGAPHTLVIVGAVAAIISLLLGIFVTIKQKRAAGAKAEIESQTPKAFLNDLHEATGSASYGLSEKPTVVGRSLPQENDGMQHLVINESTVGRRHAIIDYKDYSYWLMDLNSSNGTYLNGKRITAQAPLKHGDRVRFHKTEFEFVMPEMADSGMTLMSHTVFAGGMAANGGGSAPIPDAEELGDDDATQPRSGN